MTAQENGRTTLALPAPADVMNLVAAEGDVGISPSFDQLVSKGIIYKWTQPIRFFFGIAQDTNPIDTNTIVEEQLKPLLLTIAEQTGLGLKRVYSLSEANIAWFFAKHAPGARAAPEYSGLMDWFGGTEQDRVAIAQAFGSESVCFRFVNAEAGQINKALGYISTSALREDQEKCLARNLLYSLGLRGRAGEAKSIENAGTSSRHLTLLDQVSLDWIYRSDIEPGARFVDVTKPEQ
ncbi:MAG: DUF2927 domain-containing protein [Proteobacteria bacterium]|nr:DUF2927 domain-containing protein [Pseudomonadota bacterium]